MKILISGGAGFIGSHLARRLADQGHRIRIIDDLSTGRLENLADLDPEQCLLEQTTVAEALVDDAWLADYDRVYHLAAAVGVDLIVRQPVHTIETNVVQTAALLDAAARHGVPTLVASSSEVYGKSSAVPFNEDDDVVYGSTRFSRWSYAMTKALDEYLAMAHAREHSLPAVAVRLFNTVGPGQVGQYGMVLPRFIERAVRQRPIQVYGDGRQTRCFCHVSDVVDAMPRLLDEPSCHGVVYNLGCDEEVSINDLARRVVERAGSSSPIEHVPYDRAYALDFDDLPRRVPDLNRIRRAIGFAPTYNLDAIIDELIEQARLEAASAATDETSA